MLSLQKDVELLFNFTIFDIFSVCFWDKQQAVPSEKTQTAILGRMSKGTIKV